MTADPDVVVIGAGIAGASVAWHLSARSDLTVQVFDRGGLADETTAKSAAFFGFYGHPVERELKRYGMAVYNDFYADPRRQLQHRLLGRLRVATSTTGAADLRSEPYPNGVTLLDDTAVRRHVLCPSLDESAITAATYRGHVGYHDSRELALEFLDRARANGVIVSPEAPVEEILTDGTTVEGVRVDGDRVDAAAVVACAGPWTPRLLADVDVQVPGYQSLAPVLELESDRLRAASLPIVTHVETGAYVRDAGDGQFILAHHPPDPDPSIRYQPDDVADEVPRDLRSLMRSFLEQVLSPLSSADVIGERVGVRSHTPDGLPIIGWTGVEGLSLVAFDSSGIQLAPAAGDIVADQLLHGEVTEHYEVVSISRFDDCEDVRCSLD